MTIQCVLQEYSPQYGLIVAILSHYGRYPQKILMKYLKNVTSVFGRLPGRHCRNVGKLHDNSENPMFQGYDVNAVGKILHTYIV